MPSAWPGWEIQSLELDFIKKRALKSIPFKSICPHVLCGEICSQQCSHSDNQKINVINQSQYIEDARSVWVRCDRNDF
jgi:hypothetical protein